MITLHNPLEKLDDIKVNKETKEKTLSYVLAHKKKKNPTLWILSSALLIGCICFFILQSNILNNKKPNNNQNVDIAYSYVSIDINPSMQLTLDKDQKVVSIQAFNQDAKNIINSVNLQEKSLQKALQILFANTSFQSYLKNGIIEVGVFSNDSNTSTKIETDINAYLEKSTTNGQYHCSSVSEEIATLAKAHHTSFGKYRVIEAILVYDNSLTIEQLDTLSMKELYSILEKYDPVAVPENCRSNGYESHSNNKHNGKGKHNNKK